MHFNFEDPIDDLPALDHTAPLSNDANPREVVRTSQSGAMEPSASVANALGSSVIESKQSMIVPNSLT
jgi:hypothetical protein